MSVEQLEQQANGTPPEAPEAPRYDKTAWTGKPSLKEEDVYVESLDAWVRVRELTAATLTRIAQDCTRMKGSTFTVDQTRQRVLTFSAGVVEPKFDEQEANVMAHQHGQAFNVVCGVIDELSGTSEEAVEKARRQFRPKR